MTPAPTTEMKHTLSQLEARIAELEAENNRLANNTNRFPELMQRILDAKAEPLEPRIATLRAALQSLPESFLRYQWEADERQSFGSKWVRSVAGNNGLGMGRQAIAECPQHIPGLASYIAAANPDTIGLLLAKALQS